MKLNFSSINCNTANLSKFVNYHIQPEAKRAKSYIKDTADFINKLQQLDPLPENVLLVTINLRSLYINISYKDSLMASKEALDKCHSREPQFQVITNLLNHSPTLNNFTFSGTNYLLVKGCAMATILLLYCIQSSSWVALKKSSSIYIYHQIA